MCLFVHLIFTTCINYILQINNIDILPCGQAVQSLALFPGALL